MGGTILLEIIGEIMPRKKTFKYTVLFRVLVKIYDAMFGAFIFTVKKSKQVIQYLF